MGRNSWLNCIQKQGLRPNEPRSRFPKKPPFRPLFRALYPHPADKSALRAEEATHFLAPGKPGRPPMSTWPLFSRNSQLTTDNFFPRPFPAGYCHPPTAGLGKDRTRPDLDDRPLSLVCHQTGRSVGTNLSVLSSTDNRQPTTDNRQPTTDNRQLRSIQEEPVVRPGDDLRMGRPGEAARPRQPIGPRPRGGRVVDQRRHQV